MSKIKFTASRVEGFQCEAGKELSFFWDSTALGLGVRVSDKGTKNYIFQAKLKGETIRVKIGATAAWTLAAAQTEARRLQILIDCGQDPRKVKADAEEAAKLEQAVKQAEQASLMAVQAIEAVTMGEVWPRYLADRTPQWGERHLEDHIKMMHPGGEKRQRSKELTIPGPLAGLAKERLIDLTPQRIEEWAKVEVQTRPARARLALRILKAFLFWCAAQPEWRVALKGNPAQSKNARERLGAPKRKNDVLQREQLALWFSHVRRGNNPVICAYLQALLLTGARREELGLLKWEDIDFKWNKMVIRDKIEGEREIPLTPFVCHLITGLPRRNEWVFSSPSAADGRLVEPRIFHVKALDAAGLPHLSLHGLRRSFASLAEWVETPAGIAAQIQGHAPQGVREQNYIRRPLDLLRMWHIKIEAWILEQAGIEFQPEPAQQRQAA